MRETQPDRPKVVILGAGFGGLRAARALAGAAVDVELIDRNNYHLFQPLLYQIATAGLEPENIAKPLRAILRNQDNLTFTLAEVQHIDLERRTVASTMGEHHYDFLILATGAEPKFFDRSDLARHAFVIKELTETIELRNHILTQFELAAGETDQELRSARLTFVVVGGGPTGVETAGALVELMYGVLEKDYRELDFGEVRVVLVEALERILPVMHPELSCEAERMLERKGVLVRLGTFVQGYDGREVHFQDGERLRTRTLIWSAGVQASKIARGLASRTSSQGRVAVDLTLQVPGYEKVFVIGDAAYIEENGEPLPMMAPVAMQMADCAVENIHRLLRGERLKPFEYRDPGNLATIGRNAAVAEIRGLRFKGFVAWLVWLVVHLIKLIGFRNRLMVLINWAWNYFTYDHAVRLITRSARAPGGGGAFDRGDVPHPESNRENVL